MVGAKLRELAYVSQQRAGEPICCTAFDPLLDLLWTASSTGSLHSFICPTLDKYSVFGAHPSAVVGLLGAAEGILSVSSEYVRMHSRGGVSMLSFRDEDVLGITCCDWERPGAGRVLIGHSGSRISVLDLSTAYVASSVSVGQEIAVMRSNGRLVACGGVGGDIILKDFRTMKTEHTIDAHPGKVSSLDLKGDLLVSCGLTQRMGRIYCESVIKVFDIRQQVRPLSHIPFSPGATTLRFQPKFSSIVLATSASGAILLTDVQGGGADFQSYQVDCESDALLAADVSSSGELLAFGDSGGYVHVWGASEHALVNLHSLPTELPDIVQPMADNHICELESFSDVFLPPSNDVPFSAVDLSSPIRVGLPPRIVGRHLLEQMNAHDFVGYVQNPTWRRGSSYGSATRAVAGIRNLRQTRKIDIKGQSALAQRTSVTVLTTKVTGKGSGQNWLPKAYRRVEIKQSQFKLKYEEFDFSYYNKTRFAGLENDIVNSYCNALLQVLYFIPALQAAVTSHVCEREFCLTCELGFVLHMLDLAQGGTCQPNNLLRALRQIKEAAALGLVEGPEEWENSKEKSLAKRIQSFNRFLLEQIHKEGAGSVDPEAPSPLPSISNQLFGTMFRYHNKCRGASHEDVIQERLSFQVDLQYPAGKPNAVRPSFAELLEKSMCKQEDMRAWCPHCRAYVSLQQTRFPCSLPEILIVNCCIQREADLYYWFPDGDYTPTVESGKAGNPINGSKPTTSGIQAARSNWLPFRVEIALDPVDHSVTVIECGTEDTKDGGKSKESVISGSADSTTSSHAVYELTAMVAHVHDDFDTDKLLQEESEGHLVAHVKIPPTFSDSYGGIGLASPGPGLSPSTASGKLQLETTPVVLRGASTTSDWVLFNDFCIAPTSASDVVTLYGKQKIPCLLYYSRLEEPAVDKSIPASQGLPAGPLTIQPVPSGSQERSQASPISDETFKRLIMETRAPQDSSAVPKPYTTFLPFDMTTEFPLPRMLLGLDAEFVALSPAEKGTREDGGEYVKRPARLGLARVSVVRGEGVNAGVCCIDDYIRAVEPVYDYLTRYSGVSPGDLDPATSKHPVTTLKKAYLKLRYLVDKGCRFVGHGLKKDFRMINIVVPQAQIIDTVELFHLKRQRMLSLRFLASYLLNTNIQNETHDSIEDACTALRLYEKYKQLVAAGEFHDKVSVAHNLSRQISYSFGF
ncbi:hypothetical protein M758_6G131500 [Ceratodon purpureus]|nr:hypothetical protein M758_6G131500 [Ceratodon purpureus]